MKDDMCAVLEGTKALRGSGEKRLEERPRLKAPERS